MVRPCVSDGTRQAVVVAAGAVMFGAGVGGDGRVAGVSARVRVVVVATLVAALGLGAGDGAARGGRGDAGDAHLVEFRHGV